MTSTYIPLAETEATIDLSLGGDREMGLDSPTNTVYHSDPDIDTDLNSKTTEAPKHKYTSPLSEPQSPHP